ncbi:MAG: sterol desaturase family protein [Bacteroidota bacterium]
MLQFVLLACVAFAVMEIASYVLHRFLFHGLLWRIHQTHHRADGHEHGPFELNDLFSVGFAALSMGLMWVGREDPIASSAFPLGLGIAVYGLLYFVLHDLYTHRRFLPFKTKNPAAQAVKRAHGRHHQSLSKEGQEPFGLFLFPPSYGKRFKRKRDAA